MVTEQHRFLDALNIAMDMEKEDKEFYLQGSRKSCNEVGRKLLQSLAFEEDAHLKKMVEIYQVIQRDKGWPAAALQTDRAAKLRESFDATCQVTGVNVTAIAAEFEAINMAIGRENKSYDFYNTQSQKATFDSERDFYKAIAGEERQHELILVNYNEYLSDPVDWLTRVEHHSLDGG
jgi:rubrerythrin